MSCVSSYASPIPALQKHHTYLEFRLVCGLHRITIVLFILCSLINTTLSDRFQVSSTESVSVKVDSDVVLHCHVTPEMSAENMEIRWYKNRYHPYVHLYINGKDDYTDQRPEFTKRTELLKEKITRGAFPLKIHKVTTHDSGIYNCFAKSSYHQGSATVQLIIEPGTIQNIPEEIPTFIQYRVIIPIVITLAVLFLIIVKSWLMWKKRASREAWFTVYTVYSSGRPN